MLQFHVAAICCALFFIQTAIADEERWSRQATRETDRRVDDWVPVTDPCPTCKRSLIGEQRPGQPDDISSLLTPPAFGKPRHLPISNQDVFLSSYQNGQNSVQFPTNRPLSLRQTNFLPQSQPNPFIQEPKPQQFFGNPPSQQQQSFSYQQPPFFIPPQSHFPIPSQPQPQFDFVQQKPLVPRPSQPLPAPSPPQFNNRFAPPKPPTFPGVVTPVNIDAIQNEKEEVQLLYVPVETLQKNKQKDIKHFGKQSAEKGLSFQVTPTPQSIIKDQRFNNLPLEQLNQREPKQNFNQFGNPSSFQFQQIGDTKFGNTFDQSFRHPSFQSFPQPSAPPPPPPSFIRNENQNRFEFVQPQSIVPPVLKQTTPSFNTFNQLPSHTPAPSSVAQTASTFSNGVQYTPVPAHIPPPHQPPLAVYMEKLENSKVIDVLSALKSAKTIPVLDQVEDQSPSVFVGPSSLAPPKGYVKFELPYLSTLESNRIERKVATLPFFVAPLNFKPPPGYSKIPFPAPHIGSVVISNSTVLREAYEKPSTSKVAFSSFDYTTQKPFSQTTPLSTSQNFIQESTKLNEIPSSTIAPFETTATVTSFDYTQSQKQFDSNQFDFQQQKFTGKPNIETVPTFDIQNVQFTQRPADVEQQQQRVQDRPPQFNVHRPAQVDGNKDQFTTLPTFNEQQFNIQQGQFDARQQQFDVKEQQFSQVQPQFEEKRPLQETQPPEFTAVRPNFEVTQTQFTNQLNQLGLGQSQFNVKSNQFDIQQPQFDTVQPQVQSSAFETIPPQFETKPPQFDNQQITYEFEKPRFETSRPKDSDFNTGNPDTEFKTQNNFANNVQGINEQTEVSFNAPPQNSNSQINYQQQTFAIQNNEQQIISQQFQYEQTTETPVQEPVSTTVHIPRRKTTTPKSHYKASTPPPNYNPRRNRKPLYRGVPKNSGEIQATTISSQSPDNINSPQEKNNQYNFNSDYNPPTRTRTPTSTTERPLYEESFINNRFETSNNLPARTQTSVSTTERPQYEEPFANSRFETNNIPVRTETPVSTTERPQYEESFVNNRFETSNNLPARTQTSMSTTERPQYEDSFVNNRFETNYQTLRPTKEYQTASESYYQSESENTVIPSSDLKTTETYPQTEKVEIPTNFTQQTPNYSNYQGINQFFNQVIQQENIIPREKTSAANEWTSTVAPHQEQPFHTMQESTFGSSESPVYTESTTHTEATPQQSVPSEQDFTKKPSYSEKRHKYRQKLHHSTTTTYENTPVYENTPKGIDTGNTEKPLRTKSKYRNRQRLANRGQHRTSTETVTEENTPPHFSSVRGQNDYINTPATEKYENSEVQSTSAEQLSTKIDVGKYGTFKRRRPGKYYERATTVTEASNAEYETTTPTTRSYRGRVRTTGAPGERVTRHRVRRPSTSTTTETPATAAPSESTVRDENNNVDWGTWANSFSPSAQANDVLGPLDDQNKILKSEDNIFNQDSSKGNSKDHWNTPFSIEKSQSFEVTTANIEQNSITPASDQAPFSTNDQEALSQYENRKFSAKKLHSGFVESDNTYQENPASHLDSQLDSITFRNTEVRYEDQGTSEATLPVDDKVFLKEKVSEPKKAYDPSTGKKGGRRRGQWVRVRVKKPHQEYFETAESQNVANVGNNIQHPTKPSFPRTSTESLLYAAPEKQLDNASVDKSESARQNIYFTSTEPSTFSTTTEDSPAQFSLEKGVSAMIAEFMNADEESKDNAEENIESFENLPDVPSIGSEEVKSMEKQEGETSLESKSELEKLFEMPADQRKTNESSLEKTEAENSFENLNAEFVQIQEKLKGYENRKIESNEQKIEQSKDAEIDARNSFSPPPVDYNPQTQGSIQTQYHENFNDESENRESQLKEREINHHTNENLEFSNHKYDAKIEETEEQTFEEDEEEDKHEEEHSTQTAVPVQIVDNKVHESSKETISTELPEITTNIPESEVSTEDVDILSTTTEQPLTSVAASTTPKVYGTSTTTEISLETEICYKGRCIKSKKKRPAYAKDLFVVNH